MRSQANGVNGRHGEEEGREEQSAEVDGHAAREGGGTGKAGDGGGQSGSMQAQRLQRIRGNYQGETRELPSGQDWPRSHSAVEEREEVVSARASIPEETSGGS